MAISSAPAVTAAVPSTAAEHTEAMDKYFEALTSTNQSHHLTKLHVYIQAYFSASDTQIQTVYPVASVGITPTSHSGFGRILAIDNLVTVGPELDSPVLGRYQGSNTFADLTEPALAMNMNMVFTSGEYSGSTVSVVGRQAANRPVRVLTIAGGTGAFCLAQGVVLASTHARDVVKDTGTYLYVMYIVTPVAVPVVGTTDAAEVIPGVK